MNKSLIPCSEMSHRASNFTEGKIAQANLAQYRAAHTYGFSLKKAIKRGLVRIVKKLDGSRELHVVKVTKLAALRHA